MEKKYQDDVEIKDIEMAPWKNVEWKKNENNWKKWVWISEINKRKKLIIPM